eukprot:scaffold3635_cov31-Tisochrysis_lutea.AAC.5
MRHLRCALASLLQLLLLEGTAAHGLLTCPSPRQNRGAPIPGNEWTTWMGAAGSNYAAGYGNAQSLNGGGRNPAHAAPNSHDLCGGSLENHFMAGGSYGPTNVRRLPSSCSASDWSCTIGMISAHNDCCTLPS